MWGWQDGLYRPALQGDFIVTESTPHSFDVLVLGAGSGGYAAALRASQLGMSVGMVEESKVGGTCLHNGCIPTKALLHAAELADNAREGAKYGVLSSLEGIDMNAVNAYKHGVVDRLVQGPSGTREVRAASLSSLVPAALLGPTLLRSPASATPGATSSWQPARTRDRCQASRSAGESSPPTRRLRWTRCRRARSCSAAA